MNFYSSSNVFEKKENEKVRESLSKTMDGLKIEMGGVSPVEWEHRTCITHISQYFYSKKGPFKNFTFFKKFLSEWTTIFGMNTKNAIDSYI